MDKNGVEDEVSNFVRLFCAVQGTCITYLSNLKNEKAAYMKQTKQHLIGVNKLSNSLGKLVTTCTSPQTPPPTRPPPSRPSSRSGNSPSALLPQDFALVISTTLNTFSPVSKYLPSSLLQGPRRVPLLLEDVSWLSQFKFFPYSCDLEKDLNPFHSPVINYLSTCTCIICV